MFVPVDAPGLTYVVGRQTNDTRIVDGGALDAGNAQFAGQEALIVFDNVFVPHEHVFMDGEWQYAATLVERFTTYHRSSYVCKTGLGDVLIAWENEAFLAVKEFGKDKLEIVVPSVSILA